MEILQWLKKRNAIFIWGRKNHEKSFNLIFVAKNEAEFNAFTCGWNYSKDGYNWSITNDNGQPNDVESVGIKEGK